MTKPAAYAALLRGINVGGHTPISMPELKACFERMGFTRVSTYINSGNVVFCASGVDARALEEKIEKALHAQFNYDIKVVIRSLAEMQDTMTLAPKDWEGDKEHRLNVVFLRHEIDTPDIITDLAPRADVDELQYAPGVVFWSTKLNALTRSGMPKIVGTPIYRGITVRGFNTTRKVYELMQQLEQD